MTRRFVLAAEMTAAQDQQFASYCQQQGAAWWHWISNAWFIADLKEQMTVVGIRDKVKEITNNSTSLVVPVSSPREWAGFMTTDKAKWFHDYWEKE